MNKASLSARTKEISSSLSDSSKLLETRSGDVVVSTAAAAAAAEAESSKTVENTWSSKLFSSSSSTFRVSSIESSSITLVPSMDSVSLESISLEPAEPALFCFCSSGMAVAINADDALGRYGLVLGFKRISSDDLQRALHVLFASL